MIRLTRLNKQPIGINSDLIKFVENSPDTMITLINGEKILVLESYERVVELIVAFRRRVLAGVDPLEYASGGAGNEALHRSGLSRPAVEGAMAETIVEPERSAGDQQERD